MNSFDLYTMYGSRDRFPARTRIQAGAVNRHEKKVNKLWEKYFSAEIFKEKLSTIQEILVLEYEYRNKKSRFNIQFEEFLRSYLKAAKLNDPEIEAMLSYYGGDKL